MRTTRKGKILKAMALSKNVIEYHVRCNYCKLEYHLPFSSGILWAKKSCPNCDIELEFELKPWTNKLKKMDIFSRDDGLRHGYENNPSLRNVVKWKDIKMRIIEQ